MANHKKNLFNSISIQRPRTNIFDLSHDVKFSGKMGNLIPVMCMETVPGDSFRLNSETMIRFAPLIAPVMHRVDVSVHYFFVPLRLLWNGFDTWISDGSDSSPAAPYVVYDRDSSTHVVGSLSDYLGLPVTENPPSDWQISAYPFAAYQAIYNEYYRDQNLIDEVDYELTDGNNNSNTDLYVLRKRAWKHDYFTAALPFAQKGDEVSLPLGEFTDVDVYYDPQTPPAALGGAWRLPNGQDFDSPTPDVTSQRGTLDESYAELITDQTGTPANVAYDPRGSLLANTSELEFEAATINNLRRAFKVQEWLELNARAGTRYKEVIAGHFGVSSSDKRLQRPEYIGGSKQPVVISEVLNTTGQLDVGEESTGRPQGDMAGHGVAVGSGKGSSWYCEEHGMIMAIMSVMPQPAYQQGLPRMFGNRGDRFDYYWPKFANLGEQEVHNSELYFSNPQLEGTFGYVPRYAEYKYHPARVAGDFRTTLNFWHFGRIFDSSPALNQEFIECDPADLARAFAVQDGTDNLWCHMYHRVTAKRPMPKYGTPSF